MLDGGITSHFNRRIATERAMYAMVVEGPLEVRVSSEVDGVPEQHVVEILPANGVDEPLDDAEACLPELIFEQWVVIGADVARWCAHARQGAGARALPSKSAGRHEAFGRAFAPRAAA